MSAAQPARGVAADLAAWVLEAGRAVSAGRLGRTCAHRQREKEQCALHGRDRGASCSVIRPPLCIARRANSLKIVLLLSVQL